jgi:hypothetical protein
MFHPSAGALHRWDREHQRANSIFGVGCAKILPTDSFDSLNAVVGKVGFSDYGTERTGKSWWFILA